MGASDDSRVIDWLMEGDAAIRWQVMRDLLQRPAKEWATERERVAGEGWGAMFAGALGADGTWPKGRWTDTLWTLLVLMDLGYPAHHLEVRQAAHQFLERNLTAERASDRRWLMQRMDLCHLGFWLRIGAYFEFDRERLGKLAKTVLVAQMEDGGWNCRVRNNPKTCHSSFHTSFNVLEGLREGMRAGAVDPAIFRESETRAAEFMLSHRMYLSDKTGKVIDEKFLHLTFPSHWHYTVLRGLDYMRICPRVMEDRRLMDAIELLENCRKANGRWTLGQRIAGKTLFDMEAVGRDSRWNTLRALRVLGVTRT